VGGEGEGEGVCEVVEEEGSCYYKQGQIQFDTILTAERFATISTLLHAAMNGDPEAPRQGFFLVF